ncbi:MAG: NBR1-Ig-like domain-containing protein [Candidatus Azambacteria bacterium]|nr:NBR1-Ig-like domain-containing protein [Candidatus Azambacteria bacterium]
MKNFPLKLLSILLIISVLFVFIPVQQAEAGPVLAVVVVVAVVATAVTAVDYYTCVINIFWGGCGSNEGATANNASCLNISKPASIGVGQQFFANVTMQNTGTKVWNSDATPHSLGSQNPQDNTRWGLGRVGLPWEPVNPGQSVTFGFTSTAPSTPGSYPFDWKMVEDSIEWFGQTCQSTMVVNPTLVPPPTNLSASCPAPGTMATVSWSASPGATVYALRVNDLANGWTCGPALPGDVCEDTNSTSYSFASTPGHTYDWWVHAAACSGCPLSDATAGNFTCAPPPPGNFTLNMGGGPVSCNSVPLSWTSSSGASGYRIFRNGADITPYNPYTALNFSDTSVSQNTGYSYYIQAYNSGGNANSNTINTTTPYCPPIVSLASSPSSIYQGQSVTLTWTSVNSTSCTASGGWSGSKPLNGSQVVVPLPPPSVTYNLQCSGPGGSVQKSVTINIAPLLLPDWREIIPR